jgi:hypothetical protein
MGKTTRDEISVDLDGTIDAAIKKLQKLKKQYPDGRLNLTSDYEYGESYPHLKLEFTRNKEPIEQELEAWKEKRGRYDSMRNAAAAFASEGAEYPRSAELAELKDELGYFAEPMSSLVYGDGEVLVSNMFGTRTRSGEWRSWTLMGLDGESKPQPWFIDRERETLREVQT